MNKRYGLIPISIIEITFKKYSFDNIYKVFIFLYILEAAQAFHRCEVKLHHQEAGFSHNYTLWLMLESENR